VTVRPSYIAAGTLSTPVPESCTQGTHAASASEWGP